MKFVNLNHVAIIVSSEKGVKFYKDLGFFEVSRTIRPENHDTLVYLENKGLVLEVYVDSTHPKRLTKPEAYGLRHLCFEVDDLGSDYKIDSKGKFNFIYDPDGLPIELREVKK